jgi:hypothetical protein
MEAEPGRHRSTVLWTPGPQIAVDDLGDGFWTVPSIFRDAVGESGRRTGRIGRRPGLREGQEAVVGALPGRVASGPCRLTRLRPE